MTKPNRVIHLFTTKRFYYATGLSRTVTHRFLAVCRAFVHPQENKVHHRITIKLICGWLETQRLMKWTKSRRNDPTFTINLRRHWSKKSVSPKNVKPAKTLCQNRTKITWQRFLPVDSDLDPKMILQTDLEVDKLRLAHVTGAINIGLSDEKGDNVCDTTWFFSLFYSPFAPSSLHWPPEVLDL